MANIRAGVAYVDVKLGSVEKFKTELKEKVESSMGDSGKKGGKQFTEKFTEETRTTIKKTMKKVGDEAGRGFMEQASSTIKTIMPVLRTSLIAGFVGVALAFAPLMISAFGGAILAALGTGIIGAGIAGAILRNPKFVESATRIGTKFKEAFLRAAFTFDQPVADALKVLEKQLGPIETMLRTIFANTSQYVAPFVASIVGGFADILRGVTDASGKIKPIMDALFAVFSLIAKVVGEFFTKLTEDPEAVEGMALGLRDLGTIIAGLIIILGDIIVFFAKFYRTARNLWLLLVSYVENTMANWKRIGQTIAGVFAVIVAVIRTATGVVKNLWSSLVATFSNTMNRIKTAVTTGFNAVLTTARAVPGKIVAVFSGLGGQLYTAGVNAMRGFLNGISNMAGAIIGKARDIANTVINTISSALEIGSPSKVMERIGKWTMEGFNQGLEKTAMDMNKFVSSIPSVNMSYGSPKEPQYDKGGEGTALAIENYYANDNVDPWRQAEDWYFMVSARGGMA